MASEDEAFILKPEYKFFGSIAFTFWIFEIIITAILFKFFINKKKNYTIKYVSPIRLAIAIFIIELLVGIFMSYQRLYVALKHSLVIDIDSPAHEIVEIVGPLGGLCVVISFLLILYIFISRLYESFNETVYAYPKWFYILMVCEVTMVGIITFIGGVLGEMPIITGLAIIMYALNCIFLTILFVYSLKKVAPFKSSKDSENLVQIMVKYVALLSIAMITSLLLSILMIILGVTGEDPTLDGLIIVFQPIDAIMNVLCVYLQFDFTESNYMKVLGKYHRFIAYLFAKQSNIETDTQQQR
eukprot:475338_1